MGISFRHAVMASHGWIAVLFIAFGIGLFGLRAATGGGRPLTIRERRGFASYLVILAVLAWAAALIGAYLAYPLYRAVPPVGTVDLHAFPQRLLMASPTTLALHGVGMEWKEHVAWFAPITLTAAAAIFLRYGRHIAQVRGLRNAVVSLAILAFASAAIAAASGALLTVYAPVTGPALSINSQGNHHG